MIKEKYIISDYCIIRNNRIILNGEVLYTGNPGSPAEMLVAAYRAFAISYAKFFKMDNLCKLGFLASELLFKEKSINEIYHGDEVGILLSNAGSSIDTDRNHQKSISSRDEYFPSPSVFVYTLANIVIGEICIRHKLSGESFFLIEKEFNATRLHEQVKQWLGDEIVRCCLTGWVELDDNHYEAVLYFIQKTSALQDGITIFTPEKLTEIYLREK
jgi:hypothetical protein